MVKRQELSTSSCPVARTLAQIGDQWTLMIIRDAFDGVSRFSEFQSNLSVAKNILTERLRSLVDHGIMKTMPATDGSAYQEYRLTERGKQLFPIVVALRQWGEKFLFEPAEAHSLLIETETGMPVTLMSPKSVSGKPINADATTVVNKSR